MRVQTAIVDFLVACQADGLSASTQKWYRSQLGKLGKTFNQVDLNTITTRRLREYIIAMRQQTQKYIDAPQKPTQNGRLSEESVNTHIRVMHRFFRWCSTEYSIPNPMKGIRFPQPAKQAPKGVSAEDFIKLLQATGDDEAGMRDRALLAFLADTGCRLGGLLSLTMPNLDLERCEAVITEKGKQKHRVHFTPFTRELLHRWLGVRQAQDNRVFTSMNTGKVLTENGVSLILKRLKKRAKVTGRVNPHSFRHGFARAYLQAGGDLSTLAKLLGHKNINTTASFYALFTPDELGDLHRRYSPLRGFDLEN